MTGKVVTKEHVAHRRCFDCCACIWSMCKPSGILLSTYCLEVLPLFLPPTISSVSSLLLSPHPFSGTNSSENNHQNGITKHLTNGVCHFVITPIFSLSQHLFGKLDTSSSCKIKQLQPCLSLPPKPHYTSKPHSWHQPTRTLKEHKGSRETTTTTKSNYSFQT
jgi:hypothetical protein